MATYMGIDWSREKHDVTFLNAKGAEIETLVIKEFKHSAEGFKQFEQVREGLNVEASACVVGIESGHTLLIDFLWDKGYEQIYVLPPGMVKANRGRNRQSGARNDRYDSRVIAETLVTDLHKLYPWRPGSDGLQQMRKRVGQAERWTRQSTRLANQLQELLVRYYPQALTLLPSWPTQFICHFVLAYPTPEQARSLSYAEFEAFAKQHRYPRPSLLPLRHQALCAAAPQAQPAIVKVCAAEAQMVAQMLLISLRNEQVNLAELQQLFDAHPDAAIFASLPGVGKFLAPALLVKFGEDRKRFPHAGALQALAGTCPLTVSSGKAHSVRFRTSCDHSFRNITQQWARCAVKTSAWVASAHHEYTARGLSSSHAYRCVANRLIAVAWKIWQDRVPYDEALHLQNRAKRRSPLT